MIRTKYQSIKVLCLFLADPNLFDTFDKNNCVKLKQKPVTFVKYVIYFRNSNVVNVEKPK